MALTRATLHPSLHPTQDAFAAQPQRLFGRTIDLPIGPGQPEQRPRIPVFGRCDLPDLGAGHPAHSELLTEVACKFLALTYPGVVWHGEGTDLPPPAGTGACTLPSGDMEYLTPADCATANGAFAGVGVEGPPKGACVIGGIGVPGSVSIDKTQAGCVAAGGVYHGDGTRSNPAAPDWAYWPYGAGGDFSPQMNDFHHMPQPPETAPVFPAWPPSASTAHIDRVRLYQDASFEPPRLVGRGGCGYSDEELAGAQPHMSSVDFDRLRSRVTKFHFCPTSRRRWSPHAGWQTEETMRLRGAYPGFDLVSPRTALWPVPDYQGNLETPVMVMRRLPWIVVLRIPLQLLCFTPTGQGPFRLTLRYTSKIWSFSDGAYLNMPMVLVSNPSNDGHTQDVRWSPTLMTEWHNQAWGVGDPPLTEGAAATFFTGPGFTFQHPEPEKIPRINLRFRNTRPLDGPVGGHSLGVHQVPVFFHAQAEGPATYAHYRSNEADSAEPGGSPSTHYWRVLFDGFFPNDQAWADYPDGWPWRRVAAYAGQPSLQVTEDGFAMRYVSTGYFQMLVPAAAEPRMLLSQKAVFPGWSEGYSPALAQQIWDDNLRDGYPLTGRMEHTFWLPELVPNPMQIPNLGRLQKNNEGTLPTLGQWPKYPDPLDSHLADVEPEVCYMAEPL